MNTYKRLKNIIVVMEWIPDVTQLRVGVNSDSISPKHGGAKLLDLVGVGGGTISSKAKILTEQQENSLKNAFELFNKGDGTLDSEGLQGVLRTLGIDLESEEEVNEIVAKLHELKGGDEDQQSVAVTFSDMKLLLSKRVLEQTETGRYFVAVSLAEAQTLRAAMHVAVSFSAENQVHRSVIDNSNAALSLRLLNEGELCTIDASGLYQPSKGHQLRTATQCWRFMNSDMWYQEKELNLLLQAIEENSCKERQVWFTDIRACRRRKQLPVASTPIARLFTTPDQYHLLHYRATITKVREVLKGRKLFLLDAFRAFDSDKNGFVGCSEMYSGFLWMGIRTTPSQVHDFVREMSTDNRGFISYEEFKLGLMDPHLGEDDPLITAKLDANNTDEFNQEEMVIQQQKIQELHEIDQQETNDDTASQHQAFEVLRDLRFKLVEHTVFTKIWTTRSLKTASATCSIWKPHIELPWYARLGNKKEIFPLAHFAIEGYISPGKTTTLQLPLALQMVDTGTNGLSANQRHAPILKKVLPFPERFRLVWSKLQAKVPIYVWEPVPPNSEFKALGHVFTADSTPPATHTIRCLPSLWLKRCNDPPRLVWDDVGTVGRSGSIWRVGKMGHMVAVEGHDPPEGPFYELLCSRFYCTSDFRVIPAPKK